VREKKKAKNRRVKIGIESKRKKKERQSKQA